MAGVWATPAEVRTYSAFPEVDAKTDPELNALLDKAEAWLKVFCCDNFDSPTAEELATLKILDCGLVELFVLGGGNALFLATAFQSERIGEYGYTKKDVSALFASKNPTGDLYLDSMMLSISKCVRGAGPILIVDGPTRAAGEAPDPIEWVT